MKPKLSKNTLRIVVAFFVTELELFIFFARFEFCTFSPWPPVTRERTGLSTKKRTAAAWVRLGVPVDMLILGGNDVNMWYSFLVPKERA